MEYCNGNKNVAEKEEGELSSDDDDDDQLNNIPESSHSVQTKACKERQVRQSSVGSKGNTTDPNRNAHESENYRGCQKSPKGRKRHAASDEQNQPLPKRGNQASPGQNESDPEDVMNGYYSCGERMPDDRWCLTDRRASESETQCSVEKASKTVKRQNTVPNDFRQKLSKHRSAAKRRDTEPDDRRQKLSVHGSAAKRRNTEPDDRRQKLSIHGSAAKIPSSSRRSHTRSYLKSSSGKEYYLTKYNKLWDQRKPSVKPEHKFWDQRKPSVKPEYKYRSLQIQLSDRGQKEVVRKVKERPYVQPMEKRHRSNHSSLPEARYSEHQREMSHNSQDLVPSPQMYDNEGYCNYLPQDSNYLPTPGSLHRTTDLGRNPTHPIHQNNFPPYTHVKPYHHPPVSLPTPPQRRPHAGRLSDVIDQTLHYFRGVESMQSYSQNTTFSGNFHYYNSTSAFNGPHVKPEDMASNCSSSITLQVESAVSTSIFNRLGPEVKNDRADIQPGMDKNSRESFSETADNMCIRNTSNRNQLFPDGTMAHNTTNKRIEATTPRPVSGGESSRKLNGSMMQENLIKTKAERNLQEKEKLKKYLSVLEEYNQRLRELVFKEIKNCNSPNPYKIDRTSKVKAQNEFRTPSWAAVPDVSAQDANSCYGTLEQTEQINQLDFGLPQIDDETTADVKLASSLSESQNKFPEPQEEPKPNETNRRHVYSSPLNIFQTYRDKQASTKGITATNDKSHVGSPAQTQEEETWNKQASALEITEPHDESHVIGPAQTREEEACNKQASVLEITETHDEGHVISTAQTQEKESCNKYASALEITEQHDEGHVISSAQTQEEEACNKHASALEITETHDEDHVINTVETQGEEAYNNHVSAMEITEIHKSNVVSAADGNKQDSAKEITEIHNENKVISPTEAWETCNKQASVMESTETHEMSFAADFHGAYTTQAKEITESHDEDNVISSAADSSKQASAKENTETHNENVMSPVETQEGETGNKQASSLEITETHDDCRVVSSAETQEKEACKNYVFAMEIAEIYKNHVMSSAADGNKQDSAKKITETHNENNVISPAEAQETCSFAADLHGAWTLQAKEITESHDEGNVMSSTADGNKENTETRSENVMSPVETHEEKTCNSQALESTEAHHEGPVVSSAAETQCNKQDSAMEITKTHNESHVMGPEEAQQEADCKKDSALVTNETNDEDRVMSSSADTQEDGHKQNSAKEITETQYENDVVSCAETQEACNKHVSAMEIPETQDNVMCSATDGNKQDAAKEVSETHNEKHVINLAEKEEEETCNKQVSALVINEIDDEAYVMSSAADTQEDGHIEDSAMEISEAHAVGHGIHHDTWEAAAKDQNSRCTSLRKGVVTCKANRTAKAVKKRLDRKTTAGDPPGKARFLCPYCQRTFRARIGLTSHLRTHGSILSTPLDEMSGHHHS